MTHAMSHGRQRKVRDAIMRAGTVELVKGGAPRFDFRDPYQLALEMSWKQFAVAFLCAELGINIVFASLYLANSGCIANARPGVFSDAFFFSIETLATVGYSVMAPATLSR
jgi:inward rectifier potassium channel